MDASAHGAVFDKTKEQEKPPPKRKRFQYSVLSMLLFIGFVGSAIALYLNWSPWQRCLMGYGLGDNTKIVGYCENDSKVVLQDGNRIRIAEVGPIGATVAEILGYTPFPRHFEGRVQRIETLFAWKEDGTVASFDYHTGKIIRKYEGLKSPIVYGDFSPDNKRVLAINSDGIVQVWDLASGERQSHFEISNAPPLGSFFCAGSRRILTVQKPGQYIIWDAETGGQVADINSISNGKQISRPRISPESERAAWFVYNSKGDRETLVLADSTNGQEIRRWELTEKGNPGSFQFSPRGRWLWTTGLGNDGQLIDTANGNVAKEFPTRVQTAVFSENEKWCLIGHTLVDVNSIAARDAFEGVDTSSASMSADGELIAVGIHNCDREWAGGARIFEAKSLRMVSSIKSFAHVTEVALSPTGKCMLVNDYEGSFSCYRRIRDEDVGLLTLPEFWLTVAFGSIVILKVIRRISAWRTMRKNRNSKLSKETTAIV